MARSPKDDPSSDGARSSKDVQYSDEETITRAEAALKRMLATPHQPHKPIGKKKKSPQTKIKPKAHPNG